MARDSVTNHKNYNFSEKSSASVYSARRSDHKKLNKLKLKSELGCGNQSDTRLQSETRDTCHMRLEPGAGAEDTVTMSHHSDEGSVMPGEE